MKASKILPDQYEKYGELKLTDKKIMAGLTLASIVGVIVFGIAFIQISRIFNTTPFLQTDGAFSLEFNLLLLIFTIIAVLLFHELIHGVFFWIFTGKFPRFGFTGIYAYATAPGWYFPRNQFIWVGLAPFVVLTLLGLVLMPFLPFSLYFYLIIALTLNAAGAVGDFYVVFRTLLIPSSYLVEDTKTGMNWFGPTRIS